MLDDNIQRKILRDTVEPERALSIAINTEMGHQNQQAFSSNNNNTGVNVVQQFTECRGANALVIQQNRTTFNRESIGLCRDCGQNWTPTHR